MTEYDLVIIGGGPAGLAAAYSACQSGVRSILIIERDSYAGGILNQCIHNGFGLHFFHEELTGPEYASRFIQMIQRPGIILQTDTTVLRIDKERNVYCVSAKEGYRIIHAGAIVLAMGCRERARGAVSIPGTRCSGIFTAGTAQRYMNIEGYMVGKRVVILGSGDIGLIMARRLTLEGAKVLACVELMPYSSGLTRNIVQCLQDFNIPLYLSHTVTNITGKTRLEKVTVSKVDSHFVPVPGTETEFECDTLLLSVGLLPENELSRQAGVCLDCRTKGPTVFENCETSVSGIFACGNVLHVHDLVDNVTAESMRAGQAAAEYIRNAGSACGEAVSIEAGAGIRYTVPQIFHADSRSGNLEILFRVSRPFGKSLILVERNGIEVTRFRRDRMVPGEMEHITVPQVLLNKAGGNPVSVRAEEVPS